MADIDKDLENLILAGLGVVAYSSERGKQFIDELASQGKDALSWNGLANTELRHDPEAEARVIRESELAAGMQTMASDGTDDAARQENSQEK